MAVIRELEAQHREGRRSLRRRRDRARGPPTLPREDASIWALARRRWFDRSGARCRRLWTSARFDCGPARRRARSAKKELVGNFKNLGHEWQPKGEPDLVDVHDFPSDEICVICRR